MQIVCSECGRTIDSEFIFCPWCGVNRRIGADSRGNPSSARILEEAENGKVRWTSPDGHRVRGADDLLAAETRLGDGTAAKVSRHVRITHMERALDALEKDLSALALGEEMDK